MPTTEFYDTTYVALPFDDGAIHTTHAADALHAIAVSITFNIVVRTAQTCFTSYALFVHRNAINQSIPLLRNEKLIRSNINLDLFFLFRNVNCFCLVFRCFFCFRQKHLAMRSDGCEGLPFHRAIGPPSEGPCVLPHFVPFRVFQRKMCLVSHFTFGKRHTKGGWGRVKCGV